MLRNLFVLLVMIFLTACVSESNTETIDSETVVSETGPMSQKYQSIRFTDIKATSAERATCEAVGGVVRQAGKMGAEHCIQNLPDAGKMCRDASDCLGRCVLEGPDAHRMDSGTTTTGVCEATDEHFGCMTLVSNGEVEGTLCID